MNDPRSDDQDDDRAAASRRRQAIFYDKVIHGNNLQPLPARVAKGARLLDRKRPNWYAAINPEAIFQGPDGNDILTVLYGDYLDAILQLDLPPTGPVDHGLTLSKAHDTPRLWKHLTDHWRKEIQQRQARDM